MFERALELAGDVDRDEDDDATKRDAQGPCLQRTDAMTPRRSPDGAPPTVAGFPPASAMLTTRA